MLQEINGLPPHVLGVRASGEVTKEDLEQVLLPGLKQRSDTYDAIHYLLVLDTDISNFTTGAWLQDLKAGLQNFTKWKRIAVVSNQKGVRSFTDTFSYFAPGVAKGFSPDELQEAKDWVAAG